VMNEIILPDNAPRRYLDRQILWNEVQQIEKPRRLPAPTASPWATRSTPWPHPTPATASSDGASPV
ncbi:MAG: MobA/MobL family protein, partial [Bacteroidales bacterium]|nr:MobA/MobL family protein [Bacteroidales bacterium]